jgi:TonB family protein
MNGHRLAVVAVLLGFAAWPAFSIAPSAPNVSVDPLLEKLEAANVPVQLRLERQPFPKVLKALSRAAGKFNVVGDDCWQNLLVSVDYPQMPLKEALARLTSATGITFEVPDPRKLRVVCPVPMAKDMTPPVRITKVEPAYPEEEKVTRIGGRVMLQAVIDTRGRVRYVTVLRGVVGHPAFERSAIDAVERWQYRPALQNGDPVAIYFSVVVEFTPPAKAR